MSPARIPVNPDLGLLVLRLWVGVVGVFHGSQKLFGAFDGPGIKGFADALAKMNVPAPTVSAVLAGLAEFGGGLLIALGIFPRLAAIPVAFTMLVAWATAHHFKVFGEHGGEFALTLAAVAIAIIIAGAGRYALMPATRRSS
jgi:putative oxidoreductase